MLRRPDEPLAETVPDSPPRFVLYFQEVAVSKYFQRAIAFCSGLKAPCDSCNKRQIGAISYREFFIFKAHSR
jgi:hypothetical protein